jgi:aspartyl-tRNA(Asn)/glutamyl-tRNA(Gln) amidotransferase subunit C
MARIQLTDNDLDKYADINKILGMVSQINQVDTTNIEPMAHPLDMQQRLRNDVVTETDKRQELQAAAPENILAGIYLVPEALNA